MTKGGDFSPPFLFGLSVPFIKLDAVDSIRAFAQNVNHIPPRVVEQADFLHPIKGNYTPRIAYDDSVRVEAESNVPNIHGYFYIGRIGLLCSVCWEMCNISIIQIVVPHSPGRSQFFVVSPETRHSQFFVCIFHCAIVLSCVNSLSCLGWLPVSRFLVIAPG